MIKSYVIDTNILIQAPYACQCFEENRVILPLVVLEELDGLKKAEGEKGANARKAIRFLEKLRMKGDLLKGVLLENGGFLRVEANCVGVELPESLPEDKADNRILKVCKGISEEEKPVVLVTKDLVLRIKAQIMGNCVNRVDHAHSSALMAFQLLREWKVPDEDIAVIVSAIGQHDEKTGTAVDAVSAALILADKTDVRRNRVRNPIKENFDIHDRVNYAAVASSLQVNVEKKVILLEIELDEEICSILDYFEIFLQRMLMCKRAAEILGLKFKMKANGNKIC